MGETFRGRATFYDVGLGACGRHNSPADFVVALNSKQWDDGKHCGRQMVIRYNGKQAWATVMDESPGSPDKGLDMSRGLFNFFASEDKGVLTVEWEWAD